MDMASNL